MKKKMEGKMEGIGGIMKKNWVEIGRMGGEMGKNGGMGKIQNKMGGWKKMEKMD